MEKNSKTGLERQDWIQNCPCLGELTLQITDTHHVRYISVAFVSNETFLDSSRLWLLMRTILDWWCDPGVYGWISVHAEIFRRSRHKVYIHFRAYADLLFFGIIIQNKRNSVFHHYTVRRSSQNVTFWQRNLVVRECTGLSFSDDCNHFFAITLR